MKDINFYLDAAKEKQGITTDMQLNFAIGFKGLIVSNLRKGRLTPSDDKMLKIADLAGIPHEQALMDLNIWRAAGTPAQPVYERMAAMMRGVVFGLCLLLIVTSQAHAETILNQTVVHPDKTEFVYYGNRWIKVFVPCIQALQLRLRPNPLSRTAWVFRFDRLCLFPAM